MIVSLQGRSTPWAFSFNGMGAVTVPFENELGEVTCGFTTDGWLYYEICVDHDGTRRTRQLWKQGGF